jgi:hypothetical protein
MGAVAQEVLAAADERLSNCFGVAHRLPQRVSRTVMLRSPFT